jgi:hypothetical protein
METKREGRTGRGGKATVKEKAGLGLRKRRPRLKRKVRKYNINRKIRRRVPQIPQKAMQRRMRMERTQSRMLTQASTLPVSFERLTSSPIEMK